MKLTIHTDSVALKAALDAVADEGVGDDREQVLLWLMRNQYDISEAESYEFVLQPTQQRILGCAVDALLVDTRRDATTVVYFLFDSGASALRRRVTDLTRALSQRSAPERDVAAENPQLRAIVQPAIDGPQVDLLRIVVTVCAAPLSKTVRSNIVRASSESSVDVEVFDLLFLQALAAAESGEPIQIDDVRILATPEQVLDIQMKNGKGVVLAVTATDIAGWPGIADRTLFDLNVRFSLGINRVRRSLDRALTASSEAEEFIAFHNGITAVCTDFTIDESGLTVKNLSVVNGAQTVVAIHANALHLNKEIRLLLKLVQAKPNSDLSRNIAIRSNTQNPVTSRNLRALDAVQERLFHEVGELGFVYVVRPDQEAPTGSRVIQNDDVAQLICSIYVRKPALAVKRQVLFESPQYQEIFPNNLDPARVVFAQLVRQAVENQSDKVVRLYRSAWALTSLTLVYMTAEAMRVDASFSKVLHAPSASVKTPDQLRNQMLPFVLAACEALEDRRRSFEESEADEVDDFKVAFKQTRTLAELGAAAARISRKNARASD
jgi:hypothetical protein